MIYSQDLWIRSGDTGYWSESSGGPDFPESRVAPGSAYDEARQEMVMFGGDKGAAIFDDTWFFSGRSWTRLPPTEPHPAARSDQAMAYDSNNQLVIMFGGKTGENNVYHNDTWLWDGQVWEQRCDGDPVDDVCAQIPSPRFGSTMAYDKRRSEIVMHGGKDEAGATLEETWLWDGSTWTDMSDPLMDRPADRVWSSMVYDEVAQKVFLFGGYRESNYWSDTWHWDGDAATWIPLTFSGPSPRWNSAMVFDGLRQTPVLFGGYSAAGVANDMWAWDRSSQAWIPTDSGPPTPNARNATAHSYLSHRDRLVLFGGWADDFQDDTWELDTSVGRRPGALFEVDLSAMGGSQAEMDFEAINTRAWAGGQQVPSRQIDPGASLSGWQTHGPDVSAGQWVLLNNNDMDLPDEAPWLPDPIQDQSAALHWTSATAEEAQRLIWTPGQKMFFLLEPRAATTVDQTVYGARLAVDYIEVRVDYQPHDLGRGETHHSPRQEENNESGQKTDPL